MTLAEFDALPDDHKKPLTESWARYLGMCRRATGNVFLYWYTNPEGGFFVELHQPPGSLNNVRVRAFHSELPLQDDLTLWQPGVLN